MKNSCKNDLGIDLIYSVELEIEETQVLWWSKAQYIFVANIILLLLHAVRKTIQEGVWGKKTN